MFFTLLTPPLHITFVSQHLISSLLFLAKIEKKGFQSRLSIDFFACFYPVLKYKTCRGLSENKKTSTG